MIDIGILLIVSFVICIAGMTASAVIRQRSIPKILALAGVLAALVGIMMGAAVLIREETFHFTLWSLPALGTLATLI